MSHWQMGIEGCDGKKREVASKGMKAPTPLTTPWLDSVSAYLATNHISKLVKLGATLNAGQ